jgi:hypothetical protein
VLLRHSPPGFSSSIAYTYALTRRTRDSDEKHFFNEVHVLKLQCSKLLRWGSAFGVECKYMLRLIVLK